MIKSKQYQDFEHDICMYKPANITATPKGLDMAVPLSSSLSPNWMARLDTACAHDSTLMRSLYTNQWFWHSTLARSTNVLQVKRNKELIMYVLGTSEYRDYNSFERKITCINKFFRSLT